ncbi:NUDIX hydrolase [Mycobacterium sp. 1465703.0]|uniref:NUDIX hydrolase n=1 Tax=Mycobacterium sp. 1465703.0 TaxID=1834078 RepID=UPI0007FF4096|nr:NUDIX hydrolase [Mycobacterium sp. 1465703.0]OBI96313.1 hypothetical protein A5625_07640 [Mycobacterium sp. 1465703.0]
MASRAGAGRGHVLALHTVVDDGGHGAARWVDPQRRAAERVLPAGTVHEQLAPVLQHAIAVWAVVIDPHGRVVEPGDWSVGPTTTEAVLDAPLSHEFGYHGREIEFHKVGLAMPAGGEVPGKVELAISKDGVTKLVADSKKVWIGSNGHYYETEEARIAAGVAAHSERPETYITVPEIVTAKLAQTLPGEPTGVAWSDVEAGVYLFVDHLSKAHQSYGPTPGQGSRLGDLLPPDKFTVHQEYRDLLVNYYPAMHQGTEYYGQYTDDVPSPLGIYPYLSELAGNAREFEPGLTQLHTALRFGREGAGLIVEAQTGVRPRADRLHMLVASEPLVSIMGVLALAYVQVANVALLEDRPDLTMLAKAGMHVAPRQSLRTIVKSLDSELRDLLGQSASAIRERFTDLFQADHPDFADKDVMGLLVLKEEDKEDITVRQLLDDVLNPQQEGLALHPITFGVGLANAGDTLNRREGGLLPTVALEARYYGRPVQYEPPRMRNFSDWNGMLGDGRKLIAATQRIDRSAYVTRQLNSDPLGGPVIEALTNYVIANVYQQSDRAVELSQAIAAYLGAWPHMYSDVAQLLAAARAHVLQHLELDLFPVRPQLGYYPPQSQSVAPMGGLPSVGISTEAPSTQYVTASHYQEQALAAESVSQQRSAGSVPPEQQPGGRQASSSRRQRARQSVHPYASGQRGGRPEDEPDGSGGAVPPLSVLRGESSTSTGSLGHENVAAMSSRGEPMPSLGGQVVPSMDAGKWAEWEGTLQAHANAWGKLALGEREAERLYSSAAIVVEAHHHSPPTDQSASASPEAQEYRERYGVIVEAVARVLHDGGDPTTTFPAEERVRRAAELAARLSEELNTRRRGSGAPIGRGRDEQDQHDLLASDGAGSSRGVGSHRSAPAGRAGGSGAAGPSRATDIDSSDNGIRASSVAHGSPGPAADPESEPPDDPLYGLRVPGPPEYKNEDDASPPPYGHEDPWQNPDLSRPQPRHRAYAAIAAEARRKLQDSVGDGMPDDVDDRIDLAYDRALVALPEDLRANYLNSGWSPTLARDMHDLVGDQLGLERPDRARHASRPGPYSNAPSGLPPHPTKYANVVTAVKTLLGDRFVQLPSDVDDLIAIAYEELPEDVRQTHTQGFDGAAVRGMYDAVKAVLRERRTSERMWVPLRRLARQAGQKPAEQLEEPSAQPSPEDPPKWAADAANPEVRRAAESSGSGSRPAEPHRAGVPAASQTDAGGGGPAEIDEPYAPQPSSSTDRHLPDADSAPHGDHRAAGDAQSAPSPSTRSAEPGPSTSAPTDEVPDQFRLRTRDSVAVGHGDDWVVDADGVRRWGRYGAAGLLLRAPGVDGAPVVLLHHRAAWTDRGGTWALPGGARNADEAPEDAAKRESAEEAGVLEHQFNVRAPVVTARARGIDWTYTTVIADAPYPLETTSNAEGSSHWVREDQVAGLDLHPEFAASWDGLRTRMAENPLPPPRPSAQLDPEVDPLAYFDAYITTATRGLFFRADNDLLYRDDSRPPEVIFEQGFAPNPANAHTPLAGLVPTTRNPNLNYLGPSRPDAPVYRYTIDAPGGIDVNATEGIAPMALEAAITFPGGIRRENIVGAVEVLPREALRDNPDVASRRTTPVYGEFRENEHFNPGLGNIVPPSPLGPVRNPSVPTPSDDESSESSVEFAQPSGDPGDLDFDEPNDDHSVPQSGYDNHVADAPNPHFAVRQFEGGPSGHVGLPSPGSGDDQASGAGGSSGSRETGRADQSGLPTDWALAGSRFGDAGITSVGPRLSHGHTPDSLAKRYPWLTKVNPERGSAEAQTNCVMSAIAFVIAERERQSFQAPPTERLPGVDLLNFHRQSLRLRDDEHQVSLIPGFDSAADALASAGRGAMALIAVRGGNGNVNHVYVAVVDALGVTFLDPQRGELAADPTEATALAMLPLTKGIPTPRGSRLLTADEVSPSYQEPSAAWAFADSLFGGAAGEDREVPQQQPPTSASQPTDADHGQQNVPVGSPPAAQPAPHSPVSDSSRLSAQESTSHPAGTASEDPFADPHVIRAQEDPARLATGSSTDSGAQQHSIDAEPKPASAVVATEHPQPSPSEDQRGVSREEPGQQDGGLRDKAKGKRTADHPAGGDTTTHTSATITPTVGTPKAHGERSTATPQPGDADRSNDKQSKYSEPKGLEPKSNSPKADAPEPGPPQIPARIGDHLVLGGIDVIEKFRSGDKALDYVKKLVTDHNVWADNEAQITALFSDDGVRPKVPGMLRGGQTIKHIIHLRFGRALEVELSVNGASEASSLDFAGDTKYEFEHTSDNTNTVGSAAQQRRVRFGAVQANVSHPNASDTAAFIRARTHDSGLTNLRSDRQVSGGQTAEPATRFKGQVEARIAHRFSGSPDGGHLDFLYDTEVVVPTRDVVDNVQDYDLTGRQKLPSELGSSDQAPKPSAPPHVEYTHALNGSDVVTNLWLLADEPTPARNDAEGQPKPRGPRPQTIRELVTGARPDGTADTAGERRSLGAAFEKAFGKKSAKLAMRETEKWLTIEKLESSLHGMTNKQPLVLELKSIPGARLEVHAFIEPLGTPAAPGHSNHGGAGRERMMRPTGETKETEFHYGTEADTSRTHQDAITRSDQWPVPGRARGQGSTDVAEAQGGLDARLTPGQLNSEANSRQFRVRNTLKNPAAGQAWHGQVRLRFEILTPDPVSVKEKDPSFSAGEGAPSAEAKKAAVAARKPATFKGGVYETRARFDVTTEKSEITPITSYKGKEVWAPPERIWGDGPAMERNSSVAKKPWWRLGAMPNSTSAGPPGVADNAGVGGAADNRSPNEPPDRIPAAKGLGSMDRVINLDVSGLHGMVDAMGRRAFGSGWKSIGPGVIWQSHINRIRGAFGSMTQHSPLTLELSGPGPKTKVSFTADFEKLTYKRVVDKMLSSPSMEITEGSTSTTEKNRQDVLLGAGGARTDINNGTGFAEAIGLGNHNVRDNDRQRDQERVAVATKFEQPMAIFDGWVRMDGTMTGSRATVHESGLFRVEIAIPLSELEGAREHQENLPPTFTRDAKTGFIDDPSRPAAPQPVSRQPHLPEVDGPPPVPIKTPPPTPAIAPPPSTRDPFLRQLGERMRLKINTGPFAPRSAYGRLASPPGEPTLEAIELTESPVSSVPPTPLGDSGQTGSFPGPGRLGSPTARPSPVGSRQSSPAPQERVSREPTGERGAPPLSGRQSLDRIARDPGSSDRPRPEEPLRRQLLRRGPQLRVKIDSAGETIPGTPRRTSPILDPEGGSYAAELGTRPAGSGPRFASPLSESSPVGGRFDSAADASPPGSGPTSPVSRESPTRRATDENIDRRPPFVPERGRGNSPGRQDTLASFASLDSLVDRLPGRRLTIDSATRLFRWSQDSEPPLVPDRQDTAGSDAAHEIGPWTTPGLRDILDGWVPPPRDVPDRPDWQWKKREQPEATAPAHASLSAWHPSDMLVGIDPPSGLLDAIRDDLRAALGSSLDNAMAAVSDEFGPRVLAARLTHQSGQKWSHDIPVRGGKITVTVRPERLADAEFVGSSKKFETDLSIESQTSAAHTHGAASRMEAGGRVQVPVPHVSVSLQATRTSSIRPKEDIEDHGLLGLSGLNAPTVTGDIEHRVPARTRATEAHDLFRQPIRFRISYEQHVPRGPRLDDIPESPQPVRLHGVFSYPKDTIAPPAKPTSDEERQSLRLEPNQAVMTVRPFGDPGAAPHTEPESAGEPRDSGAQRPAVDDRDDPRTPNEDLVAAHILNSMAAEGHSVFGDKWPQVRSELAPHVRTMAIQGALGDFSRHGFRIIDLVSVPGGHVALLAHVHTMKEVGSKATTEFYTGGQQLMTSTVSEGKLSNTQGYAQGQLDALPGEHPVNLSIIGRVFGGTGTEQTQTVTDNSATGILFRKKIPTLTHTGVATVEARMFRPADAPRGDKVGRAQVVYVTRESPPDPPKHLKHVPRDGIVQQVNPAEAPPGDGPQRQQPNAGQSGLPARGLSHDSITRKITNGERFRHATLKSLRRLGITNLDAVVQNSLNDFRVASKLAAMTRVEQGDGVELMRYGNVRITGRADVQHLEFKGVEREGGNAYVLNDVSQTRLDQGSKYRGPGIRLLIGPRFRLPFLQGYLVGGGGFSYRHRDDSIIGDAARLSANAKVSRSNAVFDATTRISLTVHVGDARHSLDNIDIHSPILIPESETTPDDTPPEPVDAAKDHVEEPPPPPEPGSSTAIPDSVKLEIATRSIGDENNKPLVDQGPATAQRASLREPKDNRVKAAHTSDLPVARTADTIPEPVQAPSTELSGAESPRSPSHSLAAPTRIDTREQQTKADGAESVRADTASERSVLEFDASPEAELARRRDRYDSVPKGLAGFVMRTRPEHTNLDPDAYAHLTEFDRIGEALSPEALEHFEQSWIRKFDADWDDIVRQGSIRVFQGTDIDALARVLDQNPGYRSEYPELETFVNAPNVRQSGRTHIDSNSHEFTVQEVQLAGTRVNFHATDGDAMAAKRQHLVLKALSTLNEAGHDLPKTLHVYLPRYHRILDIDPKRDNDGQLVGLDIDAEPVDDELPLTLVGSFYPPDNLVLTSGVFSSPSAIPRPAGWSVSRMLHDSALGAMLHELAHWEHYQHDRQTYAQLDSTTEFLPGDQALVEKVSKYAGQNPQEFVAEYRLGQVLGRDYSREMSDTDEVARLTALYEAIGGNLPGRASDPAGPPPLEGKDLDDLVDALHARPGLSHLDHDMVRAAELKLKTFDRWRPPDERARLVADALSAHLDSDAVVVQADSGVRGHRGGSAAAVVPAQPAPSTVTPDSIKPESATRSTGDENAQSPVDSGPVAAQRASLPESKGDRVPGTHTADLPVARTADTSADPVPARSTQPAGRGDGAVTSDALRVTEGPNPDDMASAPPGPSHSGEAAPDRSDGAVPLRVPGDGWCLLYSVLASTPPDHWPAALGESSGDTHAAHTAVVAQLRQRREPGPIGEDTPLYRAADALRQMVLRGVNHEALPVDVTEHYRGSEHRLRRLLGTDLSEAPAGELRLRLHSLGVETVRSSHWLHPDALRTQYIEARTRDLMTPPGGPRVSEGAARAQAASEVEQRVNERTGELVLTDGALGIQGQFDYLSRRDVNLPLNLVEVQGLRDAYAETMAERELAPDERRELAEALVERLSTWRPGTGAWNTEEGEMFPALVAHALDLELRVRSASHVGARVVGPTGTGRSVDVLYNGHDHYDAIPVRERQQEHQHGAGVVDAARLDDEFGAAVGPKTVKESERDDRGQVRLNPLWHRLEDFDPAFLDREGGVWHYAIDEQGQVFIGSEDVWSIVSEKQRRELFDGMRQHDPGLTMEALKKAINDQGVPTLAARFDETGATGTGMGRVGGELFRDPVTGRWVIDASSRYTGPAVRPGVPPAEVSAWVRNAAVKIGEVLDIEIGAQDAERPKIAHGAFVASADNAKHDPKYGPLAGPKKVKDREFDDQGQVRLNPLWYRLEDFKPTLLERTGAVWHFAVDEDGQIMLGSDALLTVAEERELEQLLAEMQQKNPELTMDELKGFLDNQGHPTVAAGFDQTGATRLRPARISGELSYQDGQWQVSDKSGRYMSNKVRPGLDVDKAQEWLANVAEEMRKQFARNSAGLEKPFDEPIRAVLFKNSTAQQPAAPHVHDNPDTTAAHQQAEPAEPAAPQQDPQRTEATAPHSAEGAHLGQRSGEQHNLAGDSKDGSVAAKADQRVASSRAQSQSSHHDSASGVFGDRATRIHTLEDLKAAVERIVARQRVVPGAGDPREDLAACTVLVGEVMRELNRGAPLPVTRQTLDDSVFDGRPVRRLIGAAEPAPVGSWAEVVDRLNAAAGSHGRASAVLLVQHARGMGHAVGARRFADGSIAYFDLHRAPGDRVLDGAPPELPLGRASVVILDADGRDVTRPVPKSSSTVDALIDPVEDRRYGRGRIGAQYRGGYLELPKAVFDPQTQDLATAADGIRQRIPVLATNEKLGLTVTIGVGKFRTRPDGGRTMVADPSAPAGGGRVDEPILQFDTDPPIAELPKEDSSVKSNRANALRKQLAQLDGEARSLAEIFPEAKGWKVSKAAAGVIFHPAVLPEGTAATSIVHHTKGMPLRAVAQFMEAVGPRIEGPNRKFHEEGQAFATSVVKLFEQQAAQAGDAALADQSDLESRALKGAMWLTYLHVAALVESTLRPGAPTSVRQFSAVVLRQSLGSVRDELSEQARDFLNDNAKKIRAEFETQFLKRMGDFSDRYANATVTASVNPDLKDLQMPWLAEGVHTAPLQAVRYGPPVEAHDRKPLTAGDYLDTMLLHEANPIDPQQAFGERDHFDELDGAAGRRLLQLEVRTNARSLQTPEQIPDEYQALTTMVRDAVKAVEPSPTARAARAISRMFSSRRPNPNVPTSGLPHGEGAEAVAKHAEPSTRPAEVPRSLRRRRSFADLRAEAGDPEAVAKHAEPSTRPAEVPRSLRRRGSFADLRAQAAAAMRTSAALSNDSGFAGLPVARAVAPSRTDSAGPALARRTDMPVVPEPVLSGGGSASSATSAVLFMNSTAEQPAAPHVHDNPDATAAHQQAEPAEPAAPQQDPQHTEATAPHSAEGAHLGQRSTDIGGFIA